MRDWATRKAARIARKGAKAELRAVNSAPRLRLRLPWTRDGTAGKGDQVLRAFIQINVLPRPR